VEFLFNIRPNYLAVTIGSPLSSLNSSDTYSSRQTQKHTNKQRQTNDFKDRWIHKLTDDWPGSTQTEVSSKSTCSKVTFQFYIQRWVDIER